MRCLIHCDNLDFQIQTDGTHGNLKRLTLCCCCFFKFRFYLERILKVCQ